MSEMFISWIGLGLTFLGIFIALGKLLNRLDSHGSMLEKLEERMEKAEARFEKHMENREIHPEASPIYRRIERLEGRQGWNGTTRSGPASSSS